MSAPEVIRRTLTEQVADKLRHEIRSGLLTPGTRLRQRAIAERYAVSITPVREAFSQLEREGLLVSTPHRGVLVFHPSAADLEELYDIRVPLEALAAEKAARALDDADAQRLTAIVTEMRPVVDDPEAYAVLNRDLHLAICRAARSPRLEKLIGDLRDASSAYLRMFTAMLPTGADSQRDHEEILAALLAHDPEAAGLAVTAHLRRTVDAVSGRLQPADG